MDIYLVRHTSVNVPFGYMYGNTDVELKDSFEEEAELVKQNLSGLIFDKVWCSPLTRCVQLATYCGYSDAIREDRIKELNFGEWEMRSWEEVNSDLRSKEWFDNWIEMPTPGGESFMDQYKRVSHFLDEVRYNKFDSVCVFAHGGVLTNARVYAGEYSHDKAFENMPSYGEIIKLTF